MVKNMMNDQLKILFLALESYSLVGGLQQFNRRIVSALSELSQKHNWIQPTVILKGDKPEDVNGRSENVIFRACGHAKATFLSLAIKESKSANVLLLGHVNLLPIAFFAKLINPKIKIILFVHGVDVWGVNARKVKKIDPFLIKFVNRIASVSSFTAKKMSDIFNVNAEKFIVFPNAVDLLSERIVIDKNKKNPLLLTVSRLSENEGGKHHDSVLKALPKILEKIPNVRYRIIGDGVLRPKLEELATTLNVRNAVQFMGRVSDEDLAKSYVEASIFVMPSEKEGFGIVFLEAWLRKIPVICGTEDASHEVISDSKDGFAIHHDDTDLLAEKIIHILKNPIMAMSMGESGYQKVMQNYLMQNFTVNLEKLLDEIKNA